MTPRSIAWALRALVLTVVLAGPAAAQPAWKPLAFDAKGPLRTVREPGGAGCTIFRPAEIPERAPIVLWGNGTGQQPGAYQPILQGLASYGLVVAAANTPNAGSGADMLACLDWLAAANAREGSPYRGRLDLMQVGASGHSQGGAGALMAARDPRIKALAPVQPYTLRLPAEARAPRAPLLILSGGADGVAGALDNQKPVFDAAGEASVWAILRGAGHTAPMYAGGVFPGIIVAWFRWRLAGDAQAAAMFEGPRCAYCTSPDWALQKKAIP